MASSSSQPDPFGFSGSVPTFDMNDPFGFGHLVFGTEEQGPSSQSSGGPTEDPSFDLVSQSAFHGNLDLFNFPDVDLNFESFDMGNVLQGLTFDCNMSGGEGIVLPPPPGQNPFLLKPSESSGRVVSRASSATVLQSSVQATNNVPLAQNGIAYSASFPQRDEQFLLHTDHTPSPPSSHNANASTGLSPPSLTTSFSPSRSSIPISQHEAKLIWPIPLDERGVPDDKVLEALGLPPFGFRQIQRAPNTLTNVNESHFSQPTYASQNGGREQEGRRAPTGGPTERSKGKAKARNVPTVPAAASFQPPIIADSGTSGGTHNRINKKEWNIFVPPSTSDEGSSSATPMHSTHNSPGRIVAEATTRGSSSPLPHRRAREKVREGTASGRKTLSPAERMAQANRKHEMIAADGGRWFYVRLREPESENSRNGYGWAVAQLHRPFGNQYFIISGPHQNTERMVRPFDRMPYSEDNLKKLKARTEKTHEKLYPDVPLLHQLLAFPFPTST